MRIRLKNGKLLSKECVNRNQYIRAYRLIYDGYSPDEALAMSKTEIEELLERNQAVQLDIYYNTLCRMNDEIKKELESEIKMARLERMIAEAITGINVVGYTNEVRESYE